MKLSGKFALITAALFLVEVLIALFVHDHFIRPFVGDMLVVILIYSFLRIFVHSDSRRLVLAVLAFSFTVEFIQYFDPVGHFGLEQYRLLSLLIGRTFSWPDLLAYSVGSVVNELWLRKV